MKNRKIAFSPQELKIVDVKQGLPGVFPDVDLRNTPISYRENYNAAVWGNDPLWYPTMFDTSNINSELYNLKLSRPLAAFDMVDVFGIPWKWVEQAGGAITPEGNPILKDANDWKEVIKIPDVDSWDWETDAANNKPDPRFSMVMMFANGFWFERLISFMDFIGAAIALIDEEQQDAVYELFGALTEMACKIVDKVCYYWPTVDGFLVHDDWASQRAPFFSEEIARKLFLPHMKTLVSHIHSKGRYASLHSCGHGEDRVTIFIEAGFDSWQMEDMNDGGKLYEQYGDKIVFEVVPDPVGENASDEEMRQAARNFVDKFCKPGKPSILSYKAGWAYGSPVFMDELYSYSREKYLAQ